MDLENNFEKSEESKTNITQEITTKDSINSISTASSNSNNISSITKSNNSRKCTTNGSNNLININFDNKEEFIKYTGDYINEVYSNLLEEEKSSISKPKCISDGYQ